MKAFWGTADRHLEVRTASIVRAMMVGVQEANELIVSSSSYKWWRVGCSRAFPLYQADLDQTLSYLTYVST
jgi:hypothetical protein